MSTVEAAALALDGSREEVAAMELDKQGRLADAAEKYMAGVTKLKIAEDALPPGHADRTVLSQHCKEVQARVAYLTECREKGVAPAIPLEQHIGGIICDVGH